MPIYEFDRKCPDINLKLDRYKDITIPGIIIDQYANNKDLKIGDLSDGYHTFNELYHHRALLFATICNIYKNLAWKSKQHHDPDFPMFEGMFIVGINTGRGQATYHYDIYPYWDLFDVKELDRAPEYDGHTPEQAIERIYGLSKM